MTLGFSAKQNVYHFGISENVCCLRVRTYVCVKHAFARICVVALP